MTSKGLQEVNACSQTAETIFADGAPKQPEKPDRLISLRCRLGDSFWNCLEDSLEPFRLDAAKYATEKEDVPDSPDRLRRFGIVYYLVQNLVARRQSPAHNLQHTAIVQLLEHFVRSQHRFGMFFRSMLQSGAQLRTRVTRRNF